MAIKHYDNNLFLSESMDIDTFWHPDGVGEVSNPPIICNKTEFDISDRDEWQKPEEIISMMGITKNSLIAEIGSDDGYFAYRFAKVATKGYVYGVDIEKDMILQFYKRDELKELAEMENFESIIGKSNDPLIPNQVDTIFLNNKYQHIEDRIKYFKNLKKYFLPNGKLVIVDYKNGTNPFGPSEGVKLSKGHVVEELVIAGYSLIRESSFLPYQYILIFNIQ